MMKSNEKLPIRKAENGSLVATRRYPFIDFLVELINPKKLSNFQKNPASLMTRAGLTPIQMAAVRSGKSGWIHLLAKLELEGRDVPEIKVGALKRKKMNVTQQRDVTHLQGRHRHKPRHPGTKPRHKPPPPHRRTSKSAMMSAATILRSAGKSRATAKRKGSLKVVGTGIKAIAQMTLEGRTAVEQADKVLYGVVDVATERWIYQLNPNAESLNVFYSDDKLRCQSYNEMIECILECVRAGQNVCAAFFGHPGVFVYPSHESIRRARLEGYSAQMIPGISSDACMFADLGVDPGHSGCVSVEATDLLVRKRKPDPSFGVIIWQPACVGDVGFKSTGYDGRNVAILARTLQNVYGANYEVIVYEAAQYAVCSPKIRCVPLSRLRDAKLSTLSTIYIPPKKLPELDEQMMNRILN